MLRYVAGKYQTHAKQVPHIWQVAKSRWKLLHRIDVVARMTVNFPTQKCKKNHFEKENREENGDIRLNMLK